MDWKLDPVAARRIPIENQSIPAPEWKFRARILFRHRNGYFWPTNEIILTFPANRNSSPETYHSKPNQTNDSSRSSSVGFSEGRVARAIAVSELLLLVALLLALVGHERSRKKRNTLADKCATLTHLRLECGLWLEVDGAINGRRLLVDSCARVGRGKAKSG